MTIFSMLFTLGLSAAAGWLLHRRHVPAGMMIGAVLAASVLSVFGLGALPGSAKHLAQIIAGTFIGCSASRDDFRRLRTFWKPVILITFSLLLVNLTIGFLLYFAGYSDFLSCLVCAIPGGISDVTLIAVDFGADASKVLMVHFCRLIVGMMVFPVVVNRFTAPIETDTGTEGSEVTEPAPKGNTLRLLLALSVSALAAWLGNRLHIPAASIVCPLISTFVLNFCGFTIRFPGNLRQAAQVLSGAYVGCLLDPSHFGNLSAVLSAILITLVVLLINAVLFGWWMEKRCGVPLREGMLMLTPAGASDMALIADDLGFRSPRLVLVQIYRLLIATAVFPQICLGLSRLIGTFL